MSDDPEAPTPSARSPFLPNPSTLSSLRERPAQDQRAVLEAWVAWLNSTGVADPATSALRCRVQSLIDQLDRREKGAVDAAELDTWFSEWLETAGQVGGPEQEQDPTAPHPNAWHSNVPDLRSPRRKG